MNYYEFMKMFSKSIQDHQVNITACCPNCRSMQIYARRNIKPKWRCLDCKNVFEEPDGKIFFSSIKDFKDFISTYDDFSY